MPWICVVSEVILFPTDYPVENADHLVVFGVRPENSSHFYQLNFRESLRYLLERGRFPFKSKVVSVHNTRYVIAGPIKQQGEAAPATNPRASSCRVYSASQPWDAGRMPYSQYCNNPHVSGLLHSGGKST